MKEPHWVAVVIVGVVGLIGSAGYWRYQHPCLKYEAVWVQAWTEIRLVYCGKDCHTVVPIYHPAHYEQRCMFYGSRREGDREAAYAPIPPERGW